MHPKLSSLLCLGLAFDQVAADSSFNPSRSENAIVSSRPNRSSSPSKPPSGSPSFQTPSAVTSHSKSTAASSPSIASAHAPKPLVPSASGTRDSTIRSIPTADTSKHALSASSAVRNSKSSSGSLGPSRVLPSNIGLSVETLTTTDSAGQITTYTEDEYFQSAQTYVTSGSDGRQTTITSTGVILPVETVTTTDSAGHLTTVEAPVITLPGTTVTTTDSAGQVTTIVSQGTVMPLITEAPSSTTSSSTDTIGFLFPVTTSVDKPQPDKDGAVIPCKFWFIDLCFRWNELDIKGWGFHFPGPGVHPPGLLPPIKIGPGPGPPPIPGLHIDIEGPKLKWPGYTVGPDNLPTFPAEGEEPSCNTQTASMCATTTSYGVSGTKTTTSQVLSTCAPIYGCEVTDSATSATITGGCTSISTVTDVWVSCPISGTGSASCKTTSTSTVSGCSVEPTTFTCGASPTGGLAKRGCGLPSPTYWVYPNDGKSQQDVAAIETKLHSYVEDQSQIKTSQNDLVGISYWRLPLTSDMVDTLASMKEVGAVYADGCMGDTDSPACNFLLEVKHQDEPADHDHDHLTFTSWPRPDTGRPALSFEQLDGKYWFDDSLGKDVTVYILDTGATIIHPEFSHLQPPVSANRVRWLWVDDDSYPPDAVDKRPQNDCDTAGRTIFDKTTGGAHGTAMMSLIAGKTLGVAPNVNIVVVRLPRREIVKGFTAHDWLNALEVINEDLGNKHSDSTRGVLLLAQQYPREYFKDWRYDKDGKTQIFRQDPATGADIDKSGPWAAQVHRQLTEIAAKGILSVTGTGNFQGVQVFKLDGWPANFAILPDVMDDDHLGYIPSLLAVGQISTDGSQLAGFCEARTPLPHLYAPGLRITVAEGNQNNWGQIDGFYRLSDGTSDSAAITTGLAAYVIGLAKQGKLIGKDGKPIPDTIMGIRQHLLDTSWDRGKARPAYGLPPANAIWNGVDFRAPGQQKICLWNPPTAPKRLQRDAEPVCDAPVSVTTFATTMASLTSRPSQESSTDVGSSTSTGQDCTASAVVTQCALGLNIPSSVACITVPSCLAALSTDGTTATTASTSIPSSTHVDPPKSTTQPAPSATSPPTTPLVQKDVVCNPKLDHHGDVDDDDQAAKALGFCYALSNNPDPFPGGKIGPGGQYTQTYTSKHVDYTFSITWLEGCVTELKVQDIDQPVDGGDDCENIFINTFLNCKGNEGAGGSIQAGCVVYSFSGGHKS